MDNEYMLPMTRYCAIEIGIANAVDTVVLDKAMRAAEAYQRLDDFVSDALSAHGFPDRLTDEDLGYAKGIWPLAVHRNNS